MNQNQIRELPKLETEQLENIFNVHQTEKGYYYYNLIETVSLPESLPPSFFTSYNIAPADTWPYISYKVFKNPNVWWLILLINKIQNPLLPLPIGETILIPTPSVAQMILAETSRAK
jgi:nucleoid-associated protein YgaU